MKKLIKGSRLDERPADQIEGTWRGGKNMVNYKAFGSLANENGADNITPVAIISTNFENFPTKPVIGVIPINKGSVFFFSPSITGNDSEIGVVDELNRYLPKFRDITGRVILDLSLDSPIQGTYEYKFNNNLIIAWRDDRNAPRILNLDCLPFTLDSNFNVTSGDFLKAKSLIKLFPDIKTPNISDLFLSDNGGTLTTGSYFPIVSYELEDKSVTSWLKVYNPFPITQDSSTLPFIEYDGDPANLGTSKKLHVTFTDVDTNYINLRFGIIKLQAGIYTAYFVGSYRINGSTLDLDYTGSESTITPITLDEVLIPNAVYTKAGTITNLLGKLYLGDVEKRQQIQYQKYANIININWVRGTDISLTDSEATSYKDEKIVFFHRGFRSNEVGAFYIAFKFKDGGYSDAFHIPGRVALSGDTTVVTSPDINYMDSNVKNFQINETALINGTMGYWENDSEFYPNIDDFNSTSLGGLDLRGLPVRHHKFPEIATFVKNGMPYFHKLTSTSGVLTLDSPVFASTDGVDVDYYTLTDTVNTTGCTVTPTSYSPPITVSSVFANPSKALFFSGGQIKYTVTGIGVGETAIIEFDASYTQVFVIHSIVNNIISIPYSMTGGTGNFTGTYNIPDFFVNILPSSQLDIKIKSDRNGAGFSMVFDFTGSHLEAVENNQTNETKPLGIRVSNVIIPSSIIDEVDGWEIFYAKRDGANIRMIGQDVMTEERFHTFDLVYNQANLRGSYLKPQIRLSSNVTTTSNYIQDTNEQPIFPVVTQNIKAIESFLYVGENTLSPVNNTNRSTSIYIKIQGETVPTTQANLRDDLVDICIYRKDMYKYFDNQTLVSTGKLFKITTSGLQSVQDIYGGDTFISAFGFMENISAKDQYLIPQESASNIGLRMDDALNSKFYYPKHINSDPNPPTISYYGYNNDYTTLNDLNKIFPKTLNLSDCLVDIFVFPYLIVFSLDDANESIKLNWRIFPVNNYYDKLPKDKGRIWNLLGANRTLYIQLEYALLIAGVKDELETGIDAKVSLGVTDIFDRPPIEVRSTTEGYVGSQCQFATILTPIGYITVDRQQGKVFLVTSVTDVKEMSNEGYYHFFQKNTQTTNKLIDNPYIGNGYTAAYDQENNRVLIVKKDEENEFTLSYCGETKSWITQHDYHPNYIFSTRNGIYAGVNSNFKFYKHNSKTLKCIFYDGIMYNSYIDVVFNEQQNITKLFFNFNWITNVITLNGVVKDKETLTGLLVYNDTQCSGAIDLQANSNVWFGNDARNIEETWHFNEFRDVIKDPSLPFLDNNGELIVSNINNNKAWFDKSKFISKFAVVRFIYNNVNQRDLFIVSVDSNMRQSKR